MKIKRKLKRTLVLSIRCASGNYCDVYAAPIGDEQRIANGMIVFPVNVQWEHYPPSPADLAEAEPQITAWQVNQIKGAGVQVAGGMRVMARDADTDDIVNSMVNSSNAHNN